MAIQVVREPNFGGDLGTALGQGLQLLAQHKLQELAQNRERNQRKSAYKTFFPNASDEQVEALSNLPEKQLTSLFERGLGDLFKSPQQQVQMQQQQQERPTFEPQMQQMPGLRTPSVTDLLQSIASGKPISQEQLFQAVQQPQVPQQQIAQQQQQQMIPNQGQPEQELTFADILARPNAKQLEARTRQVETHQRRIDNVNKPYNATLDKAQPLGEAMVDKGLEMLNLLNSGKVTNGIGGLAPYITQNEASQEFFNKSNDVASLLASNSGVATNFKIKLAQERKPNLRQKPLVQRHATEDLIKEGQKITLKAKIRDDLIKENGGEQPANLQTKINDRFNSLIKQKPPKLPNGAKDGDMYLDEDTGRYWFVRNGKLI